MNSAMASTKAEEESIRRKYIKDEQCHEALLEAQKHVPLKLTWIPSTNESGTPNLSNEYRAELQSIDEYRKLKTSMSLDYPSTESVEPTLTVNFNTMKENFKAVKDWATQKSDQPHPNKDSIIVVEKRPEHFYQEMFGEKYPELGMSSPEKRRWYHRSRCEAVCACDRAKFENEKERERRITERNRPVNANMEEIGQRIKSEPGQPRLSLQNTCMDRNAQEFQRTPRMSPRKPTGNRSERKMEFRGDGKMQDVRRRSYMNEQTDDRYERNAYHRYPRHMENMRDRSPIGYDKRGNKSPDSYFRDPKRIVRNGFRRDEENHGNRNSKGDADRGNRSPDRYIRERERSARNDFRRDVSLEKSRKITKEYEIHDRIRGRSPWDRHDGRGRKSPLGKESNERCMSSSSSSSIHSYESDGRNIRAAGSSYIKRDR